MAHEHVSDASCPADHSAVSIRLLQQPSEISAAFPVMQQLRPHIQTVEQFMSILELMSPPAGLYMLYGAFMPTAKVEALGLPVQSGEPSQAGQGSSQQQGILGITPVAGEVCVGVLGCKLEANLHRGKHMYINDLAVLEPLRSRGIGAQLLAFAEDLARERLRGGWVVLDSGLQREGAHRFYKAHGYDMPGYVFHKQVGRT
mmetsp:Transcript_24200/g.52886  ORF Transcript_24200/g.52886 Transcript_24200/m.52886 type:complete len:201 (-) Transcript_24200:304-906(-)|eukprot:CAMPEP_0202914716 /NCGR_PEP_ID=MMETSP1392-20130828/63768_1 /ASSEMBLY_ACC=CAM_ASM_000868 /TAXON_ID=225041 /ORGANISM="Chlamydomonas chlamydogama, Strain SAG 11-48b" /LENGTH=200 /DNA_ID=CAMNT_0049606471 /DNA_START=68 /DNA_END=670 /DNA_ORIENTATION=+